MEECHCLSGSAPTNPDETRQARGLAVQDCGDRRTWNPLWLTFGSTKEKMCSKREGNDRKLEVVRGDPVK